MRIFGYIIIIGATLSCNKVVNVQLPAYESAVTVEMYLQEGGMLNCLLSESLPYTDTAINRPLDSALVPFSDGTRTDTLINKHRVDLETGRWFNYSHPRKLVLDTNRTYTLNITDRNKRKASATTRFSERLIKIDSLRVRPSVNNVDSFSIGVIFTDPPETENYYRLLIIKKLNDFTLEPTDMSFNDIPFNGKPFSFFSEPIYAKNDTILLRVYSLRKDHFDYMQSANNARNSNFNPFTQPSRIQSNITGGLGIFTTIRFVQKQIIIK